MLWCIRIVDEYPKRVLFWSFVAWFILAAISAVPGVVEHWYMWVIFAILKAIPSLTILLGFGSYLAQRRRRTGRQRGKRQ